MPKSTRVCTCKDAQEAAWEKRSNAQPLVFFGRPGRLLEVELQVWRPIHLTGDSPDIINGDIQEYPSLVLASNQLCNSSETTDDPQTRAHLQLPIRLLKHSKLYIALE